LPQTDLQPALLSVRNLRHRYLPKGVAGRMATAGDAAGAGGKQLAPDEATIEFGSFTVVAGTVLLVRGASGAGKSTLLHLLAGVLPVSTADGLVTVAGRALAGLPTAERDALRPFVVGWMPQRLCLIEALTLRENVLLPLALAGKSGAGAGQRADRLMDSLAIASLAARRPAAISVGQAARASLARALVAQPKLLLADEPTAALDEISARLVAREIAGFAMAGGAAVVASHDWQLREMLLQSLPSASVQVLELPR